MKSLIPLLFFILNTGILHAQTGTTAFNAGKQTDLLPLTTNWQWTQDGRGGGSQNSLSVQVDTITIAPAAHVHFTNLDTVLGAGVYRFRFKTQTRFLFAWRVSPQNAQKGTGLIFQTEGSRGMSLIHVSWSGFFYGWHNARSFRNTVNLTFSRTEWHEVEIHDTGTEITIFFDKEELPFFDGRGAPVEQFFSDVEPGYVGIGGGEGGTVQYQDLSFSPGGSIVSQTPSRSLPSPGFRPSGLAFDGTALYVSDLHSFRRIFKLDPKTGRVLDSFLAPSLGGLDGRGSPNGLAWDGASRLFVTDIRNMVYEVDTAGTTIFNSFSLPFRGGAITFDGTNLYIGNFDGSEILVTDRFGSPIRTFDSTLRPAGLAFDPATGHLWVISSFDQHITEMTTDGDLIQFCEGPRNAGVQGLGGLTVVGSQLYIAEVSDPDPFTPPEIPGTIFVVNPATLVCTATSFQPPATVPDLSLSESSLLLGNVEIDQSSVQTLMVSNKGNSRLSVTSISASDEQFTVSPTSFAVEPGASQTITVTFTPKEVGVVSSRLLISHNVAGSPASVTVSGAGVAPQVPDISVLPGLLNFGSVRLDSSKTLNLVVSNEGGGTLQIINMVTSAQGFVVSETDFSLGSLKKKTITVTFTPSQIGTIFEILDLPSNDPDKAVVQVGLHASVSTGTEGTPKLVPSITRLEFGEVDALGVVELILPIRNEGSATLDIFNIVSTDLQVVIVPRSLSISPEKTQILSVRFRPRPGRARMGEIILNGNDPDQPTLKIPWQATVAVAEQALSIVTSTPAANAINIPQETELEVTFSEPLLRFGSFVALNTMLIPQAESGPLLDAFTLASQDRQVRFQVRLRPDISYRLVILEATGRSGAKLEEAFEVGFSTGSVPVLLGSISGMVAFVDKRTFEGSVVLFYGKGDLLGRETIGKDGQYTMSNLPSGDYQVFVDVFAEGAGAISGAYDKDGDGRADILTLAAGQKETGIDLVLSAPVFEPADTLETPPAQINEGAAVALDLDGRPQNQANTSLTGVQAGDEILVSVYASNTVDLLGYTLILAYDSAQVSFKRVDENGTEGEKNLLFSAGGSAVFIRTPPADGQVELPAAILAATPETTPSGDGLLGVFRFVAQEGLSQTRIQVVRLILQSGTVQDTVAITAEATVTSASGPSAGPGEEVPGPILVDLNPSDGNQNLKTKTGVKPGDNVTLQLFADGLPEVTGFGLNIEFDPNMLNYVEQSFALGDFIPEATALATDKGEIIDAGGASLTGASGSGNGFLAKLDFKVTDAFSDSTYMAVTTIGFSLKDGTLQDQTIRVIALLKAQGNSLAADFDGDGSVGFRDFLLFAQVFGGTDPQFDLDSDGSVGFRDFLIFAQMFGKSSKVAHTKYGG